MIRNFTCSVCLLLVALFHLSGSLHAQSYDFAATPGTFTPLTGATAVDAIEVDNTMADVAIGFSFTYYGSNHTTMQVSSNGHITFESILTGSFPTNQIGNSSSRKQIIAPLWDDLNGTGGTASYKITGSAGSRVFTMEWLNWKWGYSASNDAAISFQMKLYETTNKIQFIYRQESGAPSFPSASIGLVGNTANDFYSLSDSGVGPSLDPNGFDGISTKPDDGQVYTFTVSSAATTAPTTAASAITFSPINNKSATVSWVNGNGSYRAVFIQQTSSPVFFTPVNASHYRAAAAFGSSLVGAGSAWSCIYNGTGNSFTVTNLLPATTYRVQVVEYNGISTLQKYNTAQVASGFTTLQEDDQTITFSALPAKTFGDATFDLSATASSGLTVSYTSSNTAVATVSGNTVTIVGGGTTDITATQAGNANFYAAPDVARTLTVNKANQTLTLNALPDKALGDAPFTPDVTSSSGLPVSFNSGFTAVSITGDKVTLLRGGITVKLVASQSGNSNYNAAASLEFSFCIRPAAPVISATDLDTETPVLISNSQEGNQWFKDDIIISGATSKTYTVTSPGVYSVQATVACTSALSEGFPIVVTDLDDLSAFIVLSPNPSQEEIRIDLGSLNRNEIAAVTIVDLSGHTVYSTTGNGTLLVNVSTLTKGLYIVRIETGKQIVSKQFVKTN